MIKVSPMNLIVLLLLFALQGRTQDADSLKAEVLDLYNDGFSEEILIQHIENNPARLQPLTPDDLRSLRASGLPEGVILALMAPAPAEANDAPSVEPAYVDSVDPNDPHTPGIWLHTADPDGTEHMERLEDARAIAQESGGGFLSSLGRSAGALGGGLAGAAAGGVVGAAAGGVAGGVAGEQLTEQKIKVVIDGKHADIRTLNRNPVFYFYFDPASASAPASGFGQSAPPALFAQVTHPNDFALVELDDKKDSRELDVMSYNAFGQRVGIDDTVDFRFEEIRPGVFRVTPEGRLHDDREYAFVSKVMYNRLPYAGGMIPPNIFDFSVPDD